MTASTIQQTSAIREYRGTAVASAADRSGPRLAASPITATRPPTQNDAASTCSTRLSVATSCAPPPAEWPVNATGSRPAAASPRTPVVHPHVSTVRHPAIATSAIRPVTVQAVAADSRGTTSRSNPASRTSTRGRPSASATFSGTSRNAASAHPAADHDAARSAR